MDAAHDYTELTARLAAAGWQLVTLTEKGAGFVATGKDAGGDKAERLGSTPKMALANLVMFAERRAKMRPYRSSWGTNWLDHHEDIANAYRKLPIFDEKAVPAWQALADESRAQADEIRRQIQVIPVTKHNADQYGVDPASPYSSPDELRKDVRDRKRLLVSTENVDHPVWTPQDVVNFRVTHNVLGVGQSNTPDHSWRGSNMAFQSHAPFLSPDARKALFSEIIGQGAHHEHFRTFSPPRIALMDDWLAPAEANEGHHAVNVTPTPVPAAGDPQTPGEWRTAARTANLDPDDTTTFLIGADYNPDLGDELRNEVRMGHWTPERLREIAARHGHDLGAYGFSLDQIDWDTVGMHYEEEELLEDDEPMTTPSVVPKGWVPQDTTDSFEQMEQMVRGASTKESAFTPLDISAALSETEGLLEGLGHEDSMDSNQYVQWAAATMIPDQIKQHLVERLSAMHFDTLNLPPNVASMMFSLMQALHRPMSVIQFMDASAGLDNALSKLTNDGFGRNTIPDTIPDTFTNDSFPEGWTKGASADPTLVKRAIELFDAQVRNGEQKVMSIFMGVADQLLSMGVPKADAMEAARKALLHHEDRNVAIQSTPAMKDSPDTGVPGRFTQPEFNQWPKGWNEQLERMPKRQGSPQRSHQQILDANRGQNLEGLPGSVRVPNVGPLQFHSHAGIQEIANRYNEQHGFGAHPTDYSRVDPAIAARIAKEYEKMEHRPNDPDVIAAHEALKREALAQYKAATDAGYTFDFYPEGKDPYPNSPREAVLDLHRDKHMYVFPSEAGFGMEGDEGYHQGNPMLEYAPGLQWGGKPVTYNEVFRAVHDFYGHAKEGLGFRATGEDNAYRQHRAMFSPEAQRALTAATRGQNSWVNYGEFGEHNQTATSDTIYAPQKVGLLPDWVNDPDLHSGRTSSRTGSTDWVEGDVDTYHRGLSAVDKTHPGFVTVYDKEHLAGPNVRVFTSPDGKAGFSMTDHGDGRLEVGGGFNVGSDRNIVADGLRKARAMGANYAEAFDGPLPAYYHKVMGAQPIGRDEWDERYRHPNWQEEKYGKPGVFRMTVPHIDEGDPTPEDTQRFHEAYAQFGGGTGLPQKRASTPAGWRDRHASADYAAAAAAVASIKANGGGTLDPVTLAPIQSNGFAVSLLGLGNKPDIANEAKLTPEWLLDYQARYQQIAVQSDTKFGSWKEPDGYHIDLSRVVDDRTTAIITAVDNLQIAVFSFSADADVDILDKGRTKVLDEIVDECAALKIDIKAHLARAQQHWAGDIGNTSGEWTDEWIPIDPNAESWAHQWGGPPPLPGQGIDPHLAAYDPVGIDPNRDWKPDLSGYKQSPTVPSLLMASGEPHPDGAQPGPAHDYIERQKVEENAYRNIPRWHDPVSGKMLPWWDSRVDVSAQNTAIMNAFRLAILSPQKHLKWNAAHYQELMGMPADAKGHQMYKQLDDARRAHNEALGHDPDGHLSYWKQVKEYAEQVAAKKGLTPEDSIDQARKAIFEYQLEAERRILAEYDKAKMKPKDDLAVQTAAKALVTHWVKGSVPNHPYRWVKRDKPYYKKPVGEKERTHKKVLKTPEEIKNPATRLMHPDVFPEMPEYRMKPRKKPKKRKKQPTPPKPKKQLLEAGWKFAAELDAPIRPSILPANDIYDGDLPKGDANPDAKYGMFYTSHLRSIERVGAEIDRLREAALKDIRTDGGRGFVFRAEAMKGKGISGAGSKVISFVWLMLSPMTSELGVLDTHMARVFDVPEDELGTKRDYFKFERMQRAAKDATGYADMPLGLYHWGMWDLARTPDPVTGKPMHSDHQALRPLNPADWRTTPWESSVRGKKADGTKGDEFIDPPEFARARPLLQSVAEDFDNTLGTQPKTRVPVAGWALVAGADDIDGEIPWQMENLPAKEDPLTTSRDPDLFQFKIGDPVRVLQQTEDQRPWEDGQLPHIPTDEFTTGVITDRDWNMYSGAWYDVRLESGKRVEVRADDVVPPVDIPDTLPEHWSAKTADFKTTEQIRKLKDKLRVVAKTDAGARTVAKLAIESKASRKTVREALKGESKDWIEKVLKEMKTIKRQHFVPAIHRNLRRRR